MITRLRQWLAYRAFGLGEMLLPAVDVSWCHPPADPYNADAWEKYWIDQIEHGVVPPLSDLFCHDRYLVEVLQAAGVKTILYAGSGTSQEPRALAKAGFQVVALDLSPLAIEVAQQFDFSDEEFDGFYAPEMRRPGGSVEFVVGDMLKPEVCPGPLDVVLERRTAQVFYQKNIDGVMKALAARLSPDGIFFSHSHDGCWTPEREPEHYTREWFLENGWNIWPGEGRKPEGRVAFLYTTTG